MASTTTVHAYAAAGAGKPLKPFEYTLPPIGAGEVDIDVEYCGVCHSDLSMLDNEWGLTTYPFVPGHEAIGRVRAVGAGVARVVPGQRVGLGWYARSCLVCDQCYAGRHNLCLTAEATIVGRHGAFADVVRATEAWVTPIPDAMDAASAGPLFCGGITVFNPLVINDVQPTDRVAVVGIGGLGHMAIQFCRAWGCEVTAFSTSPDKEAEARKLGAHKFIATREKGALEKAAGSFDFMLVAVNVPLDWDAHIATLRQGGHLHIVGAAPSVTATVFPLLGGQKSIGGSPVGPPATVTKMVEFCTRHKIKPVTEMYPMTALNDAMEKLKHGSPRYRLVLQRTK